jgi:hypothetical protein
MERGGPARRDSAREQADSVPGSGPKPGPAARRLLALLLLAVLSAITAGLMAAQAAPLAPGPSNGNARLEAALGQELRSLREASEATSPVGLQNQTKLPGPSPAVTVERGLLRTGQAEATLRRAVAQGLVEPGWILLRPGEQRGDWRHRHDAAGHPVPGPQRGAQGPESGVIKGQIASLGMRFTRIRQEDGAMLSLPNSQVAGLVVTNFRFQDAELLQLSLPLAAELLPQTTLLLEQASQLEATCAELICGSSSIASPEA